MSNITKQPPITITQERGVIEVGGLTISSELLRRSFELQKELDDPNITEEEARANDEALVRAMMSFMEVRVESFETSERVE